MQSLDARNHYPQIKHHTPPQMGDNNPTLPPKGAQGSPSRKEEPVALVSGAQQCVW